MLYLIKSASWNKKKNNFEFILKIGYTNDNGLSIRKSAYLNHNPTIEILYTIPNATLNHERRIHQYFEKYRVYGNEWYSYEDEIIRFFKSNNTAKSLDSVLPKERPSKKKEKKEIRENKRRKFLAWIETLQEPIKSAMQEYLGLRTLVDKLKFLCDLSDKGLLSSEVLSNLMEKHFYKYFTILGASKVKASGYNPTLLNRELGFISFDKTRLADKIYSEFIIGNRYTLVYIRDVLRRIYDELSYPKIPVATDLEQFFEVKVIQVNKSLGNGKYKRERGFEILSKK